MPNTNTTEDQEAMGTTPRGSQSSQGPKGDRAENRARPKSAKAQEAEEEDWDEEEDEEWDDDYYEDGEQKFDLLTAALLGVAVGVGATLLFRAGPGGRRPIGPLMRAMGKGASMAGVLGLDGLKWAGERSAEGADWAMKRAKPWMKHAKKRGVEMMDNLPDIDDVGEELRDYMEGAKDAIEHVVREELHDLRKAVRSKRKQWGV